MPIVPNPPPFVLAPWLLAAALTASIVGCTPSPGRPMTAPSPIPVRNIDVVAAIPLAESGAEASPAFATALANEQTAVASNARAAAVAAPPRTDPAAAALVRLVVSGMGHALALDTLTGALRDGLATPEEAAMAAAREEAFALAQAQALDPALRAASPSLACLGQLAREGAAAEARIARALETAAASSDPRAAAAAYRAPTADLEHAEELEAATQRSLERLGVDAGSPTAEDESGCGA